MLWTFSEIDTLQTVYTDKLIIPNLKKKSWITSVLKRFAVSLHTLLFSPARYLAFPWVRGNAQIQ